MLDLRNVFELVNDRLDDRSFAQQELIRKVHEMILHVFTQSSDETPVPVQKAIGSKERKCSRDPRTACHAGA